MDTVIRQGLLTALATLAVDQSTKAWALGALWPPYSAGITILPVLNLRLGFNTGVTFGLFADGAAGALWLLVVLTAVIIAFLARWLWRTRSVAEAMALGLIIGGALGNLLDRLRQGAVTDFIDAHYAAWHWPTFNMADVAIVCGVATLLLAEVRLSRKDRGAMDAAPAPVRDDTPQGHGRRSE